MFTCAISVRDLVEFIYTGGDLVSVSSSMERANLGSRIHRMLQADAKGDYQSEVYVKEETLCSDIQFIVDGRADGVRKDDDGVCIEEIKTTAIPYDLIDDQRYVHFAQVYCYAYIYCKQHTLTSCRIALIYYQIDTKQIKTFTQEMTIQELTDFYMDTLNKYAIWARLSRDIRIQSSSTLKQLQFPFDEYRNGQRTFAVAVYKSILDKQHLFAQAPTGIGKTISTLFPALKAIGEGKAEKLFYVCAKNITASVAYDTVRLLQKQPISFKTVAITAKDKICFLPKRDCDPQHCMYAKGYYDRNKDALFTLLQEVDFMDKETIQAYALKHQICPFELSLDASLYADLMICDYNYVFDPRVYLKRFFKEKGDYVFLIDEAHNLVDRSRDMYTTQLSLKAITQLKRFIPKPYPRVHQALLKLKKRLQTISKTCEDTNIHTNKAADMEMLETVGNAVEQIDAFLQSEHDAIHDEEIKEIYFNLINYTRISEYYDEHFVTVYGKEDHDFIWRLFCMNARNPLHASLQKGRCAIFFSATLSPIEYFLQVLGGQEDTRRLSLPSPFDPKQCKIIMHDQISTRYKDRGNSLIPIIETIHATVLAKAGNYIVFLPSYAYMHQVSNAFMEAYPDIQVSIQNEQMQSDEKEAFLTAFTTSVTLHVRFCVLGGIFSEGIDLKGDKLIGVMIIGTGLPQIHPLQDLIRDHFDETHAMGYAYAYQFPGMNKVLQAAGRLIRSKHDKGVIVFIDDRYTTHFYQGLFPAHMRHFEVLHTAQSIYTHLVQFWKGTL